MSNHTLLLEIFSEEIPAMMQCHMAEVLLQDVINKLKNIFTKDKILGSAFSSPRRIGFLINNLPIITPRLIEEIRGPRLNASRAAIDGFLKKYQISPKDLTQQRDFYFFIKKQDNIDTTKILPTLIQESLSNLTWPKSMRWSSYSLKWIRPIHSILCMLSDQILELQFGHIKSSNYTYGHRYIAPERITIKNADSYEKQLRQAFVEIWPNKRQEIINNSLTQQAKKLQINIIKDQKLLEEVSGLVEWPVPLIGQIEHRFLDLPKEVLITTLKNNQKYFLFESSNSQLAPFFGIVSNITTNTQNIMISNQRVVNARLSDAEFFFQNDKKQKLSARTEELKNLLFHNKIGTVYEKIQSTKSLAIKIAAQLNCNQQKIIRAIDLMKADLLTEMVKEFPELQGIMGYYYALHDKENIEVATAIKEQYKPKGPNDDVPIEPISIVVALAEKLDTLNQMFAANIKPTSSKDPFALRRAAIGVFMIQEKNNINLDLAKLDLRQDVIDFINQRKIATRYLI